MMLFLLIGWHMLADYPLQGDFLAKAKNQMAPIPGVPWRQALVAHAVIHGVGVAAITGSVVLGISEVAAHMYIDAEKCRDNLSFNEDQAWHIGLKVVWWAIATWVTS